MLRKAKSEDLSRPKPREDRGFELPLRMSVEGSDALGAAFREETHLSYMSSKGASFHLKKSVNIGSRLKLTIGLPPNLDETSSLRLAVRGKVVFIEAPGVSEEGADVFIRLESQYIIRPESEGVAT